MSVDHQAEIDELIASIETPAISTEPMQTDGKTLSSPRDPLNLTSSMSHRLLDDETGRKKRTPRQHSQRSLGRAETPPSPASTAAVLPPVLATRSSSSLLFPLQLEVPMSVDLTSDLDALAASLQTDDTLLSDDPATLSLESARASPEPHGDRNSTAEAGDKVSFLPPLLSSTPKGFASSVAHFNLSPHGSGGGSSMIKKQISLTHLHSQHAGTSEIDPILAAQSPRDMLSPRLNKNMSPSRRRLTIGTHEISPHALERLGVNTDILKKEKGMKKLGISDIDIDRSEELRRYSGLPMNLTPATKLEFIFGFTKEQLLRVKAMNRLGTSEEEVLDEYSRRVSRLGTHEPPVLHTIK